MSTTYQYAAEVYDSVSKYLGRVPIQVDWEPAEQWARFLAVQRDMLPPSGSRAPVSVKPIWHSKLGQPYTDGFQVCVHTGDHGDVSSRFEADYFRDAAERAAGHFVANARLKAGDKFRFFVSATPEEPRKAPARSRFDSEGITLTYPLREGVVGNFLRASSVRGVVQARDIPVFIPSNVLAETAALARQAGENETGGMLIGYLYRDPDSREIFSVITAQIPATCARGDSNRLEFTAEAWTEMRTGLEQRNRGETVGGWWHSHPVSVWCGQCPPERRKICPLAGGFLSSHDRALHRTMFPHPYGLALVVNHLDSRIQTHSAFGWRRGMLEQRGFHVLDVEQEGAIKESMQSSMSGGGNAAIT